MQHEVGRVGALVGRGDEHAALLRQLRSVRVERDSGIVTITGLPGSGRSTLAAAAAAELGTEGTATVVVLLDGADDRLALTDALLSRLTGAGLSTSLPEALWEAYDGAPVLLVLEDVDRVEGLAAVVDELTTGYPAATVVCTALRPTRVSGERVVRLSPLPLPADDAAADHPAVALFVDRAASRGVDIDLADEHERANVARICRHAGGLPGSIELAAARVRSMPPAVMARTLGARHGFDVSLEWSHDLLSKAAQRTLAQVSVFEGSFLLDAVAAVVELGPTSGDPAEVLLELFDAHLLGLDPDGAGEPRFVVPEGVRSFVRHRPPPGGAVGDTEAIRDRHARYFRNRSRAGSAVVRREWADIAVAIDHAISHGRIDDALTAAVALAPEVQEIPGAEAALQERINELLATNEPVPDGLRAQALMWSARAYPAGVVADVQRVGLWTAQRLAEATTLARESGDGPALLHALERTVRSLRITLDMPASVAATYEGLELARRLDDQRAIARFECWASMVVRVGGDAAEAARLAASGVVRGREHGDAVAVTTGSYLLHGLPGELRPPMDPPLADLSSLLATCEQSDQPFTAMATLGLLANASARDGDHRAAAGLLWRQLMIAANRQRSEPLSTLAALAPLLSVAYDLGEIEDAVRLRELIRPMEQFVPYCVVLEALADYQKAAAHLDTTVSEDARRIAAAEVGSHSQEQTNRWAQEVARRLAGHRPSKPVAATPVSTELTAREHEVLRALASGRTNREIAEEFGIAAKTVMHHSVAIYRKLGVQGRSGATAWAFRHGITSVEQSS